jgi:xanthine dehydrogenase YagR molybdenum-binding subunit
MAETDKVFTRSISEFYDEADPTSSPMKAEGVAELGICGVAAAVANAIYNAAGVRVRDYPITLDKLPNVA